MRVKYEAGAAALDVVAIGETVERGKEIEVDDDLGKQLLAQGWVEVRPKPPTQPLKEK